MQVIKNDSAAETMFKTVHEKQQPSSVSSRSNAHGYLSTENWMASKKPIKTP
jgi:hypothetical protein